MTEALGELSDVGYTFGYYPELQPERVELLLQGLGWRAPRIETACELGYGQGISLNCHAAASPVRWWGCDRDPRHARFARRLAEASGAPLLASEEDLASFCRRADLPQFDFVALHGVWSWIEDADRRIVVDFLRRKLRPGGVLYLSYNTPPGWAAMAPIRELLALHVRESRVAGESGAEREASLARRFDAALAFVERLLSPDAHFVRAHPHLAKRLAALRKANPRYLVHEYLAQDWRPFSFAETARWLDGTGLVYAGPSQPVEAMEGLVPAAQRAVLADAGSLELRETARDLQRDRAFRRDYWIRDGRREPFSTLWPDLEARRVVLARPRSEVSLAVREGAFQLRLKPAIYEPLLDRLADHRSRTVGELVDGGDRPGPGERAIVEAVVILLGAGILQPAHDDATTAAVLEPVRRLNGRLLAQGDERSDEEEAPNPLVWFAAARTGGALKIPPRLRELWRSRHLFGDDEAQAEDRARATLRRLRTLGLSMVRQGAPVSDDTTALGILAQQDTAFAQNAAPLLRALGVVV